MNEPINDEIREMLGRAVADAPEPRPWDEIEHRAQAEAEVAPVRHRTVVRLAAAAAACLVAIVAGFVVFIDRDDDKIRTDDDVPVVTTVPATTTVPVATSTTTVESGVASTVPAQLNRDGAAGLLGEIDADSLRPLDSLSEADVVIPTAPTNWRIFASASTNSNNAVIPGALHSYVHIARPVTETNINLTVSREPPCVDLCTFSDQSVTINGVEWHPGAFANNGLRAQVGDLWVHVTSPIEQPIVRTTPLLEYPKVIEYLEGLRVGPPEVLAAIGEACLRCDDELLLGDLDSDGLRPLDTLSEGDFLIPTAPVNWSSPEMRRTPLFVNLDRFQVDTSEGFSVGNRFRTLDVFFGQACDAEAPFCEIITDNFSAIDWPPIETEIDGVAWGYVDRESPFVSGVVRDGGAIVGVVGERAIVLAWNNEFSNSGTLGPEGQSQDVALLEDPVIVGFIEGLRVGSSDELPDQLTE